MSYHFSTGDTFELHLRQGDEKQVYRTLIDQAATDRLFVVYTPLAHGKVLLNVEGDAMEVVFSKLDRSSGRYEIYSFQAVLKKRFAKDNMPMWQIERTTDFIKVQRRDFFRLNYVRLMSIELEQRENLKVEVLSKDISAGGMRFVGNYKLNAGELVTCHLVLDPHNPLTLSGDVVTSELMADSGVKYDTRIKFSTLTKKQEVELTRQINYVQSEMLKKVASKSGDAFKESVLAHIDLQKAKVRVKDDRFNVFFGWWLGLDYMMIVFMFLMYIAARPRVEYPMERFNGIIYRTDWNSQILYANIGVSLLVLAVSAIGIVAERNHFQRRKSPNLFFVIGSFLGLLSLMILSTLFATVFN